MVASSGASDRLRPWRRATAVWLVLIGAEVIHGVLRTLVLTPKVGATRARQIGVFTGSLLNLGVAAFFIRWMGARTTRLLAGIGVWWVALTVVFEVAFGRAVLRASWQSIGADYDFRRGGLLPLGLAALAGSPLLAARLRGVHRNVAATTIETTAAGSAPRKREKAAVFCLSSE